MSKERTLAERTYEEILRVERLARKRGPSAKYERAQQVRSELIQALPTVKKFSFDKSVVDFIESTLAIATEDVIGQLHHACFPFDEFWLEGPGEMDVRLEKKSVQIGFLIKADAKDHSFSFRTITYDPDPRSQIIGPMPFQTKSIVSVTNGIVLEEDLILEIAENQANEAVKQEEKDASLAVIDIHYDNADFVARLLLILGSERFPNNMRATNEAEDLALRRKNLERTRVGLKPRLPATPIQIDLSNFDVEKLRTSSAKEIRILLGWTSVRRSKPIRRKDGTYYTRNPHDRRIPAPVDRRNVERELFSSRQDVSIQLSNEGPPKLVRLPSPAPGKSSP